MKTHKNKHIIQVQCDCSEEKVSRLESQVKELYDHINRIDKKNFNLESAFAFQTNELKDRMTKIENNNSSVFSSVKSWLNTKGILRSFGEQ